MVQFHNGVQVGGRFEYCGMIRTMPYKDIKKQKEAQARYYKEHKDLYIEKQRDKRNKNRRYIQEIKEGAICVDCNIKYPYYVLQFDHLKDKIMGVARMAVSHNLEQIKNEIAKCEIVCANCHAHRTWVRKMR